jgi:hypothetical protein
VTASPAFDVTFAGADKHALAAASYLAKECRSLREWPAAGAIRES